MRGKVKRREPLARHTTYRIGGPVSFFIEPQDRDDLKLLLARLYRYTIPFRVLGEGSNVLASDRGVSGVVIRLSAPAFKTIAFENTMVEVGAGVHLGQLVVSCAEKGLSGLECLIGIPGTVGGALQMNAGQGRRGRNIGSAAEEVTVMTRQGCLRCLKKKDLTFGYRSSNLSNYIIVSGRLKLSKRKRQAIIQDMDTFMQQRRANLDWRPSCGCVFINPPHSRASRFIDLCGFKGRRIGDACVSSKHANFIINMGEARSSDVLLLIDQIKKEVETKFKVTLHPEVKIWA